MPFNPTPGQHVLVCHDCGRVRPVTPEQQLKYVSQGWPRCCGTVMALYAEVERPHDGKALAPSAPESP